MGLFDHLGFKGAQKDEPVVGVGSDSGKSGNVSHIEGQGNDTEAVLTNGQRIRLDNVRNAGDVR